jgi:vacuolar-type H+-ATPase subunit E/Vma4
MKLVHWVIIVLAAIIVLMLLFDKDPVDPNKEREEQFKRENAILKIEKAEISARFDSVVQTSQHKAISDSVKLSVKEKEIKGFKRQVSQLRQQVNDQVDSLPVVKKFIALQDSVIQKQGETLDTFRLSLAFHRNVIKRLDNLHVDSERIASEMQAKCEARLQEVTEDYRKQARKAKRANRFLKAGAVVLGVGGFLLGSQL